MSDIMAQINKMYYYNIRSSCCKEISKVSHFFNLNLSPASGLLVHAIWPSQWLFLQPSWWYNHFIFKCVSHKLPSCEPICSLVHRNVLSELGFHCLRSTANLSVFDEQRRAVFYCRMFFQRNPNEGFCQIFFTVYACQARNLLFHKLGKTNKLFKLWNADLIALMIKLLFLE